MRKTQTIELEELDNGENNYEERKFNELTSEELLIFLQERKELQGLEFIQSNWADISGSTFSKLEKVEEIQAIFSKFSL